MEKIIWVIVVIIMVAEIVTAYHLNKMANEMKEIMERNSAKLLTGIQIKILAEAYSKRKVWENAKQCLEECADELYMASNPFGYDNMVFLTDDVWPKIASAIIALTQLAIQHKKEEEVWQQIARKSESEIEKARGIQEQNYEAD